MSKDRKSQIGEMVEIAKQSVQAAVKIEAELQTIYEDLGSPWQGISEESKELEEVLKEIYGKENVYRQKKITIIGSSGLYPEMKEHEMELIERGYAIQTIKFDGQAENVEGLVDHNRRAIAFADEVHLFWDGRSVGTILDLGMVIAFKKPLKIMKLEKKSISEYVEKYAARFKGEDDEESSKRDNPDIGGNIVMDRSFGDRTENPDS